MRSHNGCLGYRTVFYRELPDSTGHCWNVPIWSTTILDACTHEEALEKALHQFEEKFSCRKWSDTATLVEIDEALVDGSEDLPKTKRILVAEQ